MSRAAAGLLWLARMSLLAYNGSSRTTPHVGVSVLKKDQIVGIDLGGTHFRIGLFDREGHILRRRSWPTEAESGPDTVIQRLAAGVLELCAPEGLDQVVAIGVGSPGPLDPWRGVIIHTPNLPGWNEVPLRDILSSRLGVPVFLGNDANLAALGEMLFGAAMGCRDVVYFTVSTGVGGGVITDGRLLLGAHGLAGELGHTTILPNGPLCGCGNHGCLEALASGTAIAREARLRLTAGEPSRLLEMAGGDVAKVNAELVSRAAAQGDALAGEVFQNAAYHLGIGVANVLHAFDPDIVVLGGGVSLAGDMLFSTVRRVVQERAMPAYRLTANIVPAALGDDAGLMGAAALVLAEIGR